METFSLLLDSITSYLQKSVASQANELDTNSELLLETIKQLGNLEVLTLRIPQDWGGKEVDEATFQYFQELIASYSGALAFLQTQHQSAANMIFEGKNSFLMQSYLPQMSKGEILLGIGFSQLRREGNPLTIALPVDGGYLLNGQVPWVTGWGLFQEFIVAATLSDGRAVFGVVPFSEIHQSSGGNITFSPPMQFAAMTSTNTVTATLNNWFLASEYVVSIKAAGWIHENDEKNVLRATGLVLGCAKAGLNILESTSTIKSLDFIINAFEAFKFEFDECRSAIKKAQQNPAIELAEKLQLRSAAIDLAVRIAHAAITVSSGAANYSHHPAQRVYREALVFTVSGQSTALMAATLAKLTHFSKPKNTHKTITYSRVIHLSHIIDQNIPQWPNDPPVELENIAQLEKDGYYLRRFSLGEHSATHINAPNSFHADGVGIDQYSAESLIVPAIVIDICDRTTANPDYNLTIADILNWENKHNQIPAGSVVILYTGWQDKWLDSEAFFNADTAGNLHFPGFSSPATQFLIQQRQIAGVGIDTHGVDSGKDTTFATNNLVLQQPRIVLENLTNLEQLPPKGTTLVIGILRLKDGSGSPASVLALIP